MLNGALEEKGSCCLLLFLFLPSDSFVVPTPSPLCCLFSLKDLFCLAKSYKGCVAKEDLKVPFGDRAYMPGGGKLPGRSQPAAIPA